MNENDQVSLRDYFDQRLEEMNCRFKQRFEEVDSNVHKAEDQLNHRLEGMNEFRSSMKDQAATFMTRSEYDYAHRNLDEKIRAMELAKANFEGRAATISGLVSVAVSIVTGVVIFVVSHYIVRP